VIGYAINVVILKISHAFSVAKLLIVRTDCAKTPPKKTASYKKVLGYGNKQENR
jgi:hypothetical protein